MCGCGNKKKKLQTGKLWFKILKISIILLFWNGWKQNKFLVFITELGGDFRSLMGLERSLKIGKEMKFLSSFPKFLDSMHLSAGWTEQAQELSQWSGLCWNEFAVKLEMKTLNFIIFIFFSLNQIPLQMWRVLPYFEKVRAQQWQKYNLFLMLKSNKLLQFIKATLLTSRILVVPLTWRAIILTRGRTKYIFYIALWKATSFPPKYFYFSCKPEVNNTALAGTFEHQPINFSTLFPVISDLKINWDPTAALF